MFRRFLIDAEILAALLCDPTGFREVWTEVPASASAWLTARLRRHSGDVDHGSRVTALWNRQSVLEVLADAANDMLVADGRVARLRPDRNEPAGEILHWRACSLCLPPSVLLGALRGGGHLPSRVQVLDSTLRPAGPIAHLHLHLGAAASFSDLWSGLADAYLHGRPPRRHTAPDGVEKSVWDYALESAFAFRLCFVGEHTPEAIVEGCLLRGSRLTNLPEAVEQPKDAQVGRDPRGERMRARAARAFVAEVGGDNSPEIQARTSLRLTRGATTAEGSPPMGVDSDAAHHGDSEPVVIGRMLSATRQHPDLTAPVLQYLRVQSLLYRHLVMDPTSTGQTAFKRYYARIRAYQPAGAPTSIDMFADGDLDLRAVEVRRAPPKSVAELEQAMEAVCALDVDESGLVIHLIRDPEVKRWVDVWAKHQSEARKLESALRRDPTVLVTWRGLDLAADEGRGPLWLAAPALRELRAVSREVAAGSPQTLHPLRLTLHVGEDFTHLLTGLRAIAEPFLWNLIERGDRLGHALALGIDAKRWCAGNPVVRVSRWDRVLDLLWVCRVVPPSAGIPPRAMRAAAKELSHHLAVAAPELAGDLDWAAQLLDMLGNAAFIRDVSGVPMSTPKDPIQAIVASRLAASVEDGQGPWGALVKCKPRHDLPIMRAVARWLQGHLARWQTAIELNPSSNLVIGGLNNPLAQPAFQIRPSSADHPRALPATVSADDPLTFATTAADEYAYAWAGMVCEDGVSPGSARAWLDEAGAASWRARFTLPGSGRRGQNPGHTSGVSKRTAIAGRRPLCDRGRDNA